MAVLVLVAVLLPWVPSGPAGAQDDGLSIDLVDRSRWVDVGGTLSLDLAAGDEVESVDVRVHGRLGSVDELQAARTADEGPVIFTGSFPVADLAPVDGDVGRLQLDISDSVNEGATVRLAFAGVYPVVITPRSADGDPGEPIRTPVVRRSGAGTELDSMNLALAVDLSTAPTATGSGERRPFTGPELARFRRLADLLRRAERAGAPVGVLASADTVAGLAASDDPAADGLLDALARPAVTVVAQPAVPIDWDALAAAGLDDLIPRLIDDGRATITAALGPDARIDTATWDARGGLSNDARRSVAGAGFARVLVASSLLATDDPPADGASAVPMPVTVDGAPDGIEILAVDDTTSAALTSEVDGPDAAHVALADLVLRAPEPDTPVLAVIDDVPPTAALAAAFDLLSHPESPAPIVSGDADALPPSEIATVTVHPPDGGQVEDLVDLAPRIRAAVESVATYVETVGTDALAAEGARSLVTGAMQRGLSRAARERLLAAAEELTESTFDNVRFTGPSDLNLTSRSGTLPIGIVNDGDAALTVTLAAESDRLSFPDAEGQTGSPSRNEVAITVELAPGEVRVDLPVEALATGSVPLFVELRSPDGATTLDSRQLNVRSTAVSGVGLVLSAGALLVLSVWWFRTWRARRRT